MYPYLWTRVDRNHQGLYRLRPIGSICLQILLFAFCCMFLLSCPVLESSGLSFCVNCAGIFKQSMGARNRVGIHCKKELAIFPSPAGMSLTKLSLAGKKLNYSRPGRVWSVTSRLGTGKRLTLFYSVGLSYRPSRLHSLAELVPWNSFLGSLKV